MGSCRVIGFSGARFRYVRWMCRPFRTPNEGGPHEPRAQALGFGAKKEGSPEWATQGLPLQDSQYGRAARTQGSVRLRGLRPGLI